ncbi:MAG: nucleotidyltransferase domain-containing protein [Gammaproteobacteria bacterium]|nr:nucleotidyltransferase domain-containing protein [Gammaproteobacteria bacterium]
MPDRLHLSPRHRTVLVALLREHLPDVEAWAYGSRVNGRSHDGSDLDLALRAPGVSTICADRLADFGNAVRDSTIPFLVEARDWSRLPERFRREIEEGHMVFRDPCLGADHGPDCPRPRTRI